MMPPLRLSNGVPKTTCQRTEQKQKEIMEMASTCQRKNCAPVRAGDKGLPDAEKKRKLVHEHSAASVVLKPTIEMEIWWELARQRMSRLAEQ
jgi:hypothetical protein